MNKGLQRITTFDFGGSPEKIESSRQIFLIRFVAIFGSVFLLPLGLNSIIESRYWLGIILIISAVVFMSLLFFAKKPEHLIKLRFTYCSLISLLTLYLVFTGGALGTGIYYTFSLCMVIISFAGHKHGLWIAGLLLTLLSVGLYSNFDWLYPYDDSHKIRMVLGISLIFMMMLIFEWMRMRSYDALSIQSEDHKHGAFTDSLTGIYNRLGLEQNLRELQQNDYPVVFALIDIDHFKSINDSYGHHAGDIALISLVQVFRQHIKGKDLLARWGGEEFVLVFTNDNIKNMVKVLNDVRIALKVNVIEYGQSRFTLNFSAGVCIITDKNDLHRGFVVADKRLYTAKKAGRDQIVIS